MRFWFDFCATTGAAHSFIFLVIFAWIQPMRTRNPLVGSLATVPIFFVHLGQSAGLARDALRMGVVRNREASGMPEDEPGIPLGSEEFPPLKIPVCAVGEIRPKSGKNELNPGFWLMRKRRPWFVLPKPGNRAFFRVP